MPDPATIGIILLAVGGALLLMWLIYARWEHARRGENSSAISRVGYALLEANAGRKRQQQRRALIALAVGLTVVIVIAVLVLRSGDHAWSQWGA